MELETPLSGAKQSMLELGAASLEILKDGSSITSPEPSCCCNTHWSLLLREMSWMSVDYSEERKWKVHAAKRVSQMVRNYWRNKEQDKHRYQANLCAAAIQSFWLGVADLSNFQAVLLFNSMEAV
ncbi:hypothetical protein IE077_002528 [Cardiosporidium cionae]|uniref:HSA domain-containing protein n=1 Tax=Cardiosporidium cionae TaxID=476202 RepID=A0ABQ7JFN7_9APIC|nr:hypothetical protein IE077_002528 [Cardiosporidium cionae]|eukprot:KAF8822804.1 hypothetical protein IE077_002528 [Cardiosporidium cionae]